MIVFTLSHSLPACLACGFWLCTVLNKKKGEWNDMLKIIGTHNRRRGSAREEIGRWPSNKSIEFYVELITAYAQTTFLTNLSVCLSVCAHLNALTWKIFSRKRQKWKNVVPHAPKTCLARCILCDSISSRIRIECKNKWTLNHCCTIISHWVHHTEWRPTNALVTNNFVLFCSINFIMNFHDSTRPSNVSFDY